MQKRGLSWKKNLSSENGNNNNNNTKQNKQRGATPLDRPSSPHPAHPRLARVATQLETFHGDRRHSTRRLWLSQAAKRAIEESPLTDKAKESADKKDGGREEGSEESREPRVQLKSGHSRLESSAQVASDAVYVRTQRSHSHSSQSQSQSQ